MGDERVPSFSQDENMLIAVPKETFPGERRVCLAPGDLPKLAKAGMQVLLEQGAGQAAGYPDSQYTDKGATVVGSRAELWEQADAVCAVRALGADREQFASDKQAVKSGQMLVCSCDPLGAPEQIAEWAESGGSLLALELIPRITRAQSMDVLSSMATVAGYRAVLQAAIASPRMFPMMMTAAGTLAPARVFVIGAGVAGLQAIATSRRLGAVVHAYDLRPACREQVESLGGKFVELELDAANAQDQGGYAKSMGDDFYERQQALMAEVVAESDVVITTAAVPGKQSPLLVNKAAVEGMAPGSVIVDLAAERGGNCELSEPDQRVEHQGVTILGPTNLPSEAPTHASQMYSRNVATLLLHVVEDGQWKLEFDDAIVKDTLAAHDGVVRNARLREILNLPPLEPAEVETGEAPGAESGND